MAAPFLSNLGIPQIEQARMPTASGFPPAFNQNNRAEWAQAVHSISESDNSLRDWGLCIKEYVRLCEARGVYPFQSVQQTRNDAISDYLRDRRRSFIQFIDKAHFFENVRIRTTDRQVKVTDSGFVLTITATAYIKDPTFENWLIQSPLPRFDLVRHDGRHTKVLMSGLDMFAYRDQASRAPERWIIGYDIICPIYPDLPDNHTPSRAELEEFILAVLWMPLLRSMRPKQLLHRLI